MSLMHYRGDTNAVGYMTRMTQFQRLLDISRSSCGAAKSRWKHVCSNATWRKYRCALHDILMHKDITFHRNKTTQSASYDMQNYWVFGYCFSPLARLSALSVFLWTTCMKQETKVIWQRLHRMTLYSEAELSRVTYRETGGQTDWQTSVTMGNNSLHFMHSMQPNKVLWFGLYNLSSLPWLSLCSALLKHIGSLVTSMHCCLSHAITLPRLSRASTCFCSFHPSVTTTLRNSSPSERIHKFYERHE